MQTAYVISIQYIKQSTQRVLYRVSHVITRNEMCHQKGQNLRLRIISIIIIYFKAAYFVLLYSTRTHGESNVESGRTYSLRTMCFSQAFKKNTTLLYNAIEQGYGNKLKVREACWRYKHHACATFSVDYLSNA